MRTLREYIDIINELSEVRRPINRSSSVSKGDKAPGPITVTKIDPITGQQTTAQQEPKFTQKKIYYRYKIPSDGDLDIVPLDAVTLGLKFMRREGDYWLFRTKDDKPNPAADAKYGPGERVERAIQTGTPHWKFDLGPTIRPNTPYWKNEKK